MSISICPVFLHNGHFMIFSFNFIELIVMILFVVRDK